jgi:UDP-glucose 4-epimerase
MLMTSNSNPSLETSNVKRQTSNSQPIRVVITGGAGFIGSHIADECVKRGWQVTILDDLSSGSLANIQHLLTASDVSRLTSHVQRQTSNLKPDTSNVTNQTSNSPVPETSNVERQTEIDFVRGSITNLELLQNLFRGVDYVFHQAAIASVPQSIWEPVKSHEVNLTGTLNVLIAAKDQMVKKVVFASSSAVYGDTPEEYKKEDQMPQPQSPYAVTKLAGEHYCQVFSHIYKLPTTCLRYFNVYGPRQSALSDYAAVIPKFIDRINHNKTPIIYGDGLQTRDFVAVQDVAKANLLAAETDATGAYNIGSGEITSLNQLAELLSLLMGRTDLRAVYEKERQGDIKHSLADISQARNIGYAPYYQLADGLRQLLGIKLI